MDRRDSYYPTFDPNAECEWTLCPTCQGRGKHTNPNIDRHGLTAEDFDEDPDFELDYRRGVYDIICVQCKGNRVVPDTQEYLSDAQEYERWAAEEEAERIFCYGYDY